MKPKKQRKSIINHARKMRKQPTGPETILWNRLRNKQLGGFYFRRQHPIDRFIVDFYCHAARVAVELDGSSHENQETYDKIRTAWLESKGVRVIRFWNSQVINDIDNVLGLILKTCHENQ